MNGRITIERRGLMLVLSSPSGAGKTTLTRRLLEMDPRLTLSISATTRAARPGEVDGQDYFFVSPEHFSKMVAEEGFLEHANVFGRQYGTPRRPVEEALAQGRDVVFDIDWQGTQQLKERARDDVVSIFVLPPSREALEKRLATRAQDSAETIKARMATADAELSHWAEYDYVIINDSLDHAFAEVQMILAAERLKRTRQSGLSRFVAKLTK